MAIINRVVSGQYVSLGGGSWMADVGQNIIVGNVIRYFASDILFSDILLTPTNLKITNTTNASALDLTINGFPYVINPYSEFFVGLERKENVIDLMNISGAAATVPTVVFYAVENMSKFNVPGQTGGRFPG